MSTDIRICFLGDSLVIGTEDDSILGWPGRVCAGARARGIPITHYNLGIRRETTSDLLLRWKEECHRRLPSICDGRLVISTGVNDTSLDGGRPRVKPEESIANIQCLLSEAMVFRVLVVGPHLSAMTNRTPESRLCQGKSQLPRIPMMSRSLTCSQCFRQTTDTWKWFVRMTECTHKQTDTLE